MRIRQINISVVICSFILGLVLMIQLTAAAEEAETGKDCGPAEKYFPKSQVESIYGKKISYTILIKAGAINPAGTKESANCRIFFDSSGPLSRSDNLATSYVIYNSDSSAISAAAKPDNPNNVQMDKVADINIGDRGTLWVVGAGSPLPTYMMQIHKGPLLLGVLYWDSNNRSKAEDLLRGAVQDSKSSPTPSPNKSVQPSASKIPETKAPVITSITRSGTKSSDFPAGIFSNFTPDGQALYKYYYGYATIRGKNLSGSVLSSDNKGNLAGDPAIEFRKIESYDNGKMLIAQIVVKTFAKEGTTNIIATDYNGQSKYPVTITITGTQYLQRLYKDKPIFFGGDWADKAPNSNITNLIQAINKGLLTINHPSYQKLFIIPYIFEADAWNDFAETRFCGDSASRGFRAAGCASPGDSIIYQQADLSDLDWLSQTILHESAHKLHFYNLGKYFPIPSRPSGFQARIKTLSDPEVAYCLYIPVKILDGRFYWFGDNDSLRKPRCGFIYQYGASGVYRNLKNNDYYEHVATLTQARVFAGDLFNYPEAKNNPAYGKEINLLKEYGFVK